MLGTLSIAAGTGIAGWLLQHAYQHMRYSSYEREDAAMLAPGADPEQRRSWLAAIAPQISIQAVAPSTIDALAASGDIDAGLLPARAAGAYARRYNPTLAGEAHWVPAYLAAGLAGAAMSPAAAVAAVSLARHRGERHPLPHRPDPPPRRPRRLLRSLAFCPTPGGRRDHGGRHGPHLGASAPACAASAANGETATPSCSDAVLGADRGETPTVLTLVPALGAASLLFIACSHQIGVKTSAMPLAPVISLALIASLAAGAMS